MKSGLILLFAVLASAAPDTLPSLVEQAQAAEQQNRLDDAISLYKRILQLRPGWASAELNLGLVYHSRGDHAAAIRLLTDALHHQPNLHSALLFRGSSYYQTDHPGEAVRDLTEYLRRQPDDPEALPILAGAYLSKGDPAQAALIYAALGRITNDPAAYFRLSDTYARVAGHVLRRLPEAQAERFRTALTAQVSAEATDFEAATRNLIATLAQPVSGSDAASRLAETLHRLAQAAAEKVLALAPDSPWSAILRAQAADEAGKTDLADQEYKRALSAPGATADMYVRYGQFQCKLSRFDEGLSMYEQALQMDPASPQVTGLIGEVHLLQNRPQKAVEYLRKAVQLNPRETQTRLYLAQALTQTGHAAEALQALQAAPEDPDGRVHYALARAYMQQGEAEKARKAMDVFRQRRGVINP